MVTFGIDRSKPAPWYYLDPETGIMQTGWKQLGNNGTISVHQELWELVGIKMVQLGII